MLTHYLVGFANRAPIVAKCDRERVLSSWAPFCGNVAPKEFLIDFAGVRHLTPRQFVEKLSQELGIGGVVAGFPIQFSTPPCLYFFVLTDSLVHSVMIQGLLWQVKITGLDIKLLVMQLNW